MKRSRHDVTLIMDLKWFFVKKDHRSCGPLRSERYGSWAIFLLASFSSSIACSA